MPPLLAMLDPLPFAVRVLGTLLAGCAILASMGLFWSHRRMLQSREAEHLTVARRFGEAILMTLAGLLLAIGVWIHPGEQPRYFLIVWFTLMMLVSMLLIMAGTDLFQVRQRATRERALLIAESKASLDWSRKNQRRKEKDDGR